MEIPNLTKKTIEFVLKTGADLVGVGDASSISPERNLIQEPLKSRLTKVIVAAIRLSESVLAEILDKPTRTYYHHYRMVNMALDQLGLKITQFLQDQSFAAYPVPASQLVDWGEQKGVFSHKHAAVAAGLGWIGRNNLLVTPQFGSQVRLLSVLTDAPLQFSQPSGQDCGACRACLDVCPCQAIADDPGSFDHQRCYDQLDRFVRNRVVGQHICGVCVRACGPQQVQNR